MNQQTSMTDEQLIQFYLNGDPKAMATLVELYKDRIYRSVCNMVQEQHVAEEIFQQVFICLINEMIAGNPATEGNFLRWANSIAKNLCIEYTRKTRIRDVIEGGENSLRPVSVLAPFGISTSYDNHNKIKALIDQLPENQREVMVLNHYGGLSFKEIAEMTKCTLNAALDTMKYALNNLRKMMQEKEAVLN